MLNPNTTITTGATPRALLIHPGHDLYDEARAPWNLAVDQRPACICVATEVAHVQHALAYAREHGLTVASQSTGHLSETLPSLERTLLLRLDLHRGAVEVDPVERVARIKAGARWGDVVEAVKPHGLAVMHGSSPSVGVIGYLLGGGLSFYGRKHGLAVNHVHAFEVVTADGIARRADADHNPSLFYALRGGQGGYAVVTAVELGLLPYREVTAGAMFFPAQSATAVLRAWRNWTTTAPDSMTTTFRILCLPPVPDVPEPLRGVPTVCVNGVALDPAEAVRLEAQLRYAATPMLGGFGPAPAAAIVRLHQDPEAPVPALGDGMLISSLDDWAIDSFLRVSGLGSGSPLLAAELRHLGGALASPPSGAGARGHLEGSFLAFGVGVPGMPASAADLDAYLDRFLNALMPWATGTRFTSFNVRSNSLKTCVPDATLARLSRIKETFDPDGLLIASHLPTTRNH